MRAALALLASWATTISCVFVNNLYVYRTFEWRAPVGIPSEKKPRERSELKVKASFLPSCRDQFTHHVKRTRWCDSKSNLKLPRSDCDVPAAVGADRTAIASPAPDFAEEE